MAGRETILECSITANPHGLTIWEKKARKVVNTDNREIEIFKVCVCVGGGGGGRKGVECEVRECGWC